MHFVCKKVADAKGSVQPGALFETGVSTFVFSIGHRWLFEGMKFECTILFADPLHYTTSKAMTSSKQSDISTHVLDAISLYICIYTYSHVYIYTYKTDIDPDCPK